ncbi:DUF3772 domain-containing protein [Phaeovibrio sulfidiphilus]|uniref:DUF3772 domain-containing protein n=1 Tax=Phaeovibrio sulfidiphilus TaxID=1220600 RepID=A0A8J6YLD9_9PROT|nr:DUF3772 domain-containing protein [Phaeovibrio sulfidiphilus]MBE1236718.1 DUF3772 domain-containing protein [Phaeovibrio sulfidiphilus]
MIHRIRLSALCVLLFGLVLVTATAGLSWDGAAAPSGNGNGAASRNAATRAEPAPTQAVVPATAVGTLPTAPLSQRVDESLEAWTKVLDDKDARLERGGLTGEALDEITAQLRSIRDAARKLLSQELDQRVVEAETVLNSLSPPETGGEASATEDPQKAAYAKDLDTWKTRQRNVEAVETRASTLINRISNQRRTALVSNLFERTDYPWLPASVGSLYKEFVRTATSLAGAPAEWLASIQEDLERTSDRIFVIGLWISLGVVTGVVLRWWILKKFGRRSSITDPSYTRRVIATLAEGTANGLLPALVLGSMVYWASVTFSGQALLGDFTKVVLYSALLILVARGFTRAALAPDQSAWRLLPQNDRQARTLSWLVQALVIVLSLEMVFLRLNASMVPSFEDGAYWFCLSAFKFLEGAILLRLSVRDLWTFGPAEDVGQSSSSVEAAHAAATDDAPSRGGATLVFLVRALVILATLVGACAPVFGYGRLGEYLINGLLTTFGIAGIGLVLRSLFNELVEVSFRSSWLRSRFNWGDRVWYQLRFWSNALVSFLIFGLFVFFSAPVWGVPSEDVQDAFITLLTGVKVGTVTISLLSIVIGVGVFVVLMALTRGIQSTLGRKVLVQTNMDHGARSSLITGVGYLGAVISAVVGVSAMGIDLTNVALIAGALSVGIGFGLQNIINNFVSGLILLVERPIKVGDSVIIGSDAGTVRRISFRATELETAAKAAIIIPNSSLISSPFTNLTHRNRLGRVRVDVVVGADSDVAKVRDILLDAAREHDLVLTLPAPSVTLDSVMTGVNGQQAGSLSFALFAHTSNVSNASGIQSDLRMEIVDKFRAAGISFA